MSVATEYKYIRMLEIEQANNRKTRKWNVCNVHSNDLIGWVDWYGPWRQYCFSPSAGTVFSAGCLADIQDFLGKTMAEWRASR